MASAALAAPIASVSPSSSGRATVTALGGGGLRSARTTCSPLGQPGVVLRSNVMLRSVRQRRRLVPRSSSSDEPKSTTGEKTPFGYSRKDVLLIGVGVTLLGYGLKYGLEKRLESFSEAELQVLLEQVEEEKQLLTPVRDQGITFTRKTEDQTNAS